MHFSVLSFFLSLSFFKKKKVCYLNENQQEKSYSVGSDFAWAAISQR